MSAIDEIKQKLDITEVVSDYLKLQKAGRNFKALCPFHPEKTPSLIISPERQSWHCFGCGTGGDLLSFVMKKEGLSFGETLKLLASRAGVTLVQRQEPSREKTVAERLRQVNEVAAQYYHSLLLDSLAAQTARDYLVRRGVKEQTTEDFQLGFSLNSWNSLQKHLLKQGIEEEKQVAAGLLIEGEGKTYDRFRNRLMFPIKDAGGKVVGFGARALGDDVPKYLNSPQTPVFDKGGLLYGLDRAKRSIRERGRVIFMEGYMDVIMAHQQGTANAVATMGVALTEKQISLLKGLTKNLVLALDPDVAGEEATKRGVEVARHAFQRQLSMRSWLGATFKLDADIEVLPLPKGRDPAEIIREDPQAWERMMEKPQPLMDYLIEAVTSKLDLTDPRGRSAACEQLLPVITEMEDGLQREVYFQKLARLAGVTERTLVGMAAKLQPTPREKTRGVKSAEIYPAAVAPPGERLENYCLSLLLQHSQLKEESGELALDHFQHSGSREIFGAWREMPDLETLRQNLDVNLHDHLDSLLKTALPPMREEQLSLALADCVRRLRERRLRDLKAHEEFLIGEMETTGPGESASDPERITVLLQEGMEVNRELGEIFREKHSRKSKVVKGDEA